MFEHVIDLPFGRHRCSNFRCALVGRPNQSAGEPGHDEHDPAVLRLRQHYGLISQRKSLFGKHEMSALAGNDIEARRVTSQLLGLLGPDTGRVDEVAGANYERRRRFAAKGIRIVKSVYSLYTDYSTSLVPESRDRAVVGKQ